MRDDLATGEHQRHRVVCGAGGSLTGVAGPRHRAQPEPVQHGGDDVHGPVVDGRTDGWDPFHDAAGRVAGEDAR